MRHTNRALAALATLAALSLIVVAGCGGQAGGGGTLPPPSASPPTAPPTSPSVDITGVVRDLTPGDGAAGPTLLVVADSATAGTVDRASVRVTAATVVWKPVGEGRRELTVSDLAAGQRVAVRFVGPVAESYPVQATAGDIEIISPL